MGQFGGGFGKKRMATIIFINRVFSRCSMGRIKTSYLKRKTKELFKLHGEKLCSEFTHNKEQTNAYASIGSKKLRNIIAGYMTRLKQKEQ